MTTLLFTILSIAAIFVFLFLVGWGVMWLLSDY